MKRLLPLAAVTMSAATGYTTMSTGAASASSADWTWPGQKFLVGIGNNVTKTCAVCYPGMDIAGNRYCVTAGHCFRTTSGSHCEHSDGTASDVSFPATPQRRSGRSAPT